MTMKDISAFSTKQLKYFPLYKFHNTNPRRDCTSPDRLVWALLFDNKHYSSVVLSRGCMLELPGQLEQFCTQA